MYREAPADGVLSVRDRCTMAGAQEAVRRLLAYNAGSIMISWNSLQFHRALVFAIEEGT